MRAIDGRHGEVNCRDVRLVHLLMNWVPSLRNSRGISARSLSWSDILNMCVVVCWVSSGIEGWRGVWSEMWESRVDGCDVEGAR